MPPTPPAKDWEPLFDELAELGAEACERRLAGLRQSDPELARFLTELLAADAAHPATATDAASTSETARAPTDFTLETPIAWRNAQFVARALDVTSEPVARDRSGERIESWRLVRPLGHGGMAEVYLAERIDGEFEQRAALKLIRAEVGSESIHRRFLRERRILAQLEHPGIARLLDGGRTSTGEPYFVLELVTGRRITDHCNQEKLPLADRLRLFAECCDAVDAAHRRLVVHRDLKPSNILVTPAGQVKLLDFGIAKLLDPGPDGGTPIASGSGSMTRFEAQPLTPSYAAPEQIFGEPISTATDVFALGILLYELVAGMPPFLRSAESRGALALEVANETLTSPSAALKRFASAAASPDRELLKRRASEIEGDLDTVIGKALAREPERRYHSAAEFADDVRSFLARRPVRARPDSLGYRMARFVARHRAAVVLATVAALAVVALISVALVQGEVARRQARRAERVSSFLVELFKEADPSRTRGAQLTAREMISTAAARIEHELADDPDVAAELDDAVAQVEIGLGLADEAAALAQSAIALRTRSAGADDSATLRIQVTLAEALFAQGDLAGTGAAVAAAQPLYERTDDPAVTDRLFSVESALRSQDNRFEEGVALARKALARSEKRAGPNDASTLLWRARLAGMLGDASQVAEAVALLEPSLPALMSASSGNPLFLAEARLTAVELLDLAGQRVTGESVMQSAVDLFRQTLGAEHPEVALAEIKLGFLQFERRALDSAETTLCHAATVLDRVGHYEAGSARRYLGSLYLEKDDPATALVEFEAAERIFRERSGGAIYLTAARISHGLGLLRLGRLVEAEAILRDVVSSLGADESRSDYTYRTALKYLAEVRRARGDAAQALALHRQVRELELQIFGSEDHPTLAHTDGQIALDLLARGDRAALAEARQRIDRAIAFQRESEPTNARLGDFLLASARIAAVTQDSERAARDASEGCDLLLRARGANHSTTRDAEAFLQSTLSSERSTSGSRRR